MGATLPIGIAPVQTNPSNPAILLLPLLSPQMRNQENSASCCARSKAAAAGTCSSPTKIRQIASSIAKARRHLNSISPAVNGQCNRCEELTGLVLWDKPTQPVENATL